MKNNILKYSRKIAISLFLFIVAVCLASLVLLNLPSFYESTPQQMLLIFTVTAFAFLVIILLVNTVFISPFLNSYLKDMNWIFVIIMFVILTITLSLGSVHYWNIPIRHAVDICWDSDDAEEALSIQKLVDPNNNRLHSSTNFGVEKYPLFIKSGTCISGFIIELDPINPQIYFSKRLNVLIHENPPGGRFFISINDVPSVVNLNNSMYDDSVAEIIVNEGFERGTVFQIASSEYLFLALKLFSVLLSAFYLSVFFFGMTEYILNFPDKDD